LNAYTEQNRTIYVLILSVIDHYHTYSINIYVYVKVKSVDIRRKKKEEETNIHKRYENKLLTIFAPRSFKLKYNDVCERV